MRVVIQRSQASRVQVDGQTIGEIDHGLVLLVGVTETDTSEDVAYCARKIARMRIFADEEDKMNLSIQDVGGSILSISQFTLYANTQKGNRPSFIEAARPELAEQLYEELNDTLQNEYNLPVETGEFGAMMDVQISNDGPVTIILDS